MDSLAKAICCFGRRNKGPAFPAALTTDEDRRRGLPGFYLMEKRSSASSCSTTTEDTAIDRAVDDFLNKMSDGKKLDEQFKASLAGDKDRFRAEGWTESFANAIFDRLSSVIMAYRDGDIDLGDAMKEALAMAERIADDVFKFAIDHPAAVAVFCTILAIGVLFCISPWVLEVLGFMGEEGIIEGSIAARWQALYGGYVSRRSLFSYLQHLGATIGK